MAKHSDSGDHEFTSRPAATAIGRRSFLTWGGAGLAGALGSVATATASTAAPLTEGSRSHAGRHGFRLGVETLLEDHLDWLEGDRVGILTNPTGVDQQLRSTVDLLIDHAHQANFQVTTLYGVEHGYTGGYQPGNGQAPDTYVDTHTGLRVYNVRPKALVHNWPSSVSEEEYVGDVDTFVFDLQDNGTRFFTWQEELFHLTQLCSKYDKKLVVLDRPNPQGYKAEGRIGKDSALGHSTLPVRHGLTLGEVARLYEGERVAREVDLRVARMRGYQPHRVIEDYPVEWLPPTPYHPTRDATLGFPALGIVAGTNYNIGRGTARPFQFVGAPWTTDSAEANVLADNLNARNLPGVQFTTMWATVIGDRFDHHGEYLGGVSMYFTDRSAYDAVRTGVHVIDALYELYPEQTSWTSATTHLGTTEVREKLLDGVDPDSILDEYEPELREFVQMAEQYRLYRPYP